MKRLVILFCTLSLLIFASACSATCKYEMPYGRCTEKATGGGYCQDHRCDYCPKPIISGSHFCEEHLCQFDIGYGRCTRGISIIGERDGVIYCDTHSAIEDIDELVEACSIAETWCSTISEHTAELETFPMKLTGDFYIETNGINYDVRYRFQAKELSLSPNPKTVDIIVDRGYDGELELKGLRPD